MHKRAFTLVELIVVITILAILWTIAFISLQWYSSEARDAKRWTDVRGLLTKLNIEQTSKWLSYKEMLKSPEMHNLRINWDDTAESYEWTINFELLKEGPNNFRDPDTKADYEFATANWTSSWETYNFIQWRYWSEKENKEVILWNYYQFQEDDAFNLFKKSMTGQKPETPNPSTNSCNSILPNIDNIITTPWTATQENQSWQNNDSNEACYYTCEAWYDWTDSTKTACYELLYITEASTIWCGENNPDIIATINWTKLRIAWCNASWTSWTWVPVATTYTETWNISWIPWTIHYYYTWQNAMDWCASKWWRLPTKDEFDSMISTFWWTLLSSSTTPYSAVQTKPPYFMYPAGYWHDNYLYDQNRGALYWSSTKYDNTNAYRLSFDTNHIIMSYHLDNTYSGFSVRCVKNY